jgi:hypothetical protein
VLAIGPKVRGFRHDRGRWILKTIEIHSTTALGGEVKPSAHVVKFYGMLKIPAEYDRDTSSAKFKDISHQLPA